MAFIGIGWDQSIDRAAGQMGKQIEALEKAKRENPALDIRMTRDVLRHLQNEFKSHKGNVNQQVFTIEEVRAVVDHVTGSTQPANSATMQFFDEAIAPRLLKGDLQLREYTKPKVNDTVGSNQES